MKVASEVQWRVCRSDDRYGCIRRRHCAVPGNGDDGRVLADDGGKVGCHGSGDIDAGKLVTEGTNQLVDSV